MSVDVTDSQSSEPAFGSPAAGYRRRILIEPAPGRVTAELEDDYHRMVVMLRHRDGIIVETASEMKRAPWTLCPGAMAQSAETFTGVAVADVARRGAKTQNCTHLHDLALFAAAHANDMSRIAYDILVTDPVGGERRARLIRDGATMLDWRLAGDRFLAPPALTGLTLRDLGGWIAGLHHADAEAARILRWAAILAYGRGMDIPAGISATAFPAGSCYNFQAERAPGSTRRPGADVDFTAPGAEPLADRARLFDPTEFGRA